MPIVLGYPCNNIDYLTNKEEKPNKISLDTARVAYSYPELGIVILKPIIDRLIFGFFPSSELLKKCDPGMTLTAYQEYIRKSAYGDAIAAAFPGLTFLTGVSFNKPPYSNYNVNLAYTPPGCSERIILQIGPKKPSYASVKFDMKPSALGGKGVLALWDLVKMLFLIGTTAAISHEDFLIHSKIWVAEIAVDMLGVSPQMLEVRQCKGGKVVATKRQVIFGLSGEIESVYPCLKKSGSKEYVYDKRRERLDAGATPVFGDHLHSRAEFRVTNTSFFKLKTLKNRLARLGISAVNDAALKAETSSTRFLIACVQANGKAFAFAQASPSEWPALQKHLNKILTNIWKPSTIWKTWSNVIDETRLLS